MTATFTNAPGTRDVDTVRVEIDDRDCDPETDALLSDEEIQYFIDTNSHILLAAAAAADSVAIKFASDPKRKKVGDLDIDYGEGGRSGAYRDMAAKLRARAVRKAPTVATGTTISGHDAAAADTDKTQPSFTVGMDDNPESGGTHTDRGVMDY